MTGSHIRGTESAGSKLTVISRERIDASGYGHPDPVAAGYAPVTPSLPAAWPVAWVAVLSLTVLAFAAVAGRRGIARQAAR